VSMSFNGLPIRCAPGRIDAIDFGFAQARGLRQLIQSGIADERGIHLRESDAQVRFLSLEPLLARTTSQTEFAQY